MRTALLPEYSLSNQCHLFSSDGHEIIVDDAPVLPETRIPLFSVRCVGSTNSGDGPEQLFSLTVGNCEPVRASRERLLGVARHFGLEREQFDAVLTEWFGPNRFTDDVAR